MGAGRNPADPTGLPLGFDPASERGPSLNDQRHRFVLSGIVQLPLGLRSSAILIAAPAGRSRRAPASTSTATGRAAATARAATPRTRSSRVGRHSETTRGQFNLDMRLSRTFRVGSTATLELIAEVFNVFDTVNYASINDVFGAGAFPDQPATDAAGRVTYGLYNQTLPPRQMQLALKVGF